MSAKLRAMKRTDIEKIRLGRTKIGSKRKINDGKDEGTKPVIIDHNNLRILFITRKYLCKYNQLCSIVIAFSDKVLEMRMTFSL